MPKTREEIALAYKSQPWWYDIRGFFILTFAYNSTLPAQLRFFGPNFGPRHLEVACGTGTLLKLILDWRRWKRLPEVDIVGVDYAESMLAGAQHRFRGRAHIKFVHADVANMPFDEASFDTANVANALHCLPEVDASLRGIQRTLKPGGIMAANVLMPPRGSWVLRRLATAINRWGVRKGILVATYERDDIRCRIVKAGFEIVTESVSGNCYNVLAKRSGVRPS